MDPQLFLADLHEKPRRLAELAELLRGAPQWPVRRTADQVVLLGMGSSNYANQVVATRLRNRGIRCTAELASSDLLPQITDDTLVVAVSASGGSVQTLDAAERLRGRETLVALTDDPDSKIAQLADATIAMHAGPERGGVACRTFQHTLVQLLALEHALLGTDVAPLVTAVEQAAEASATLLESTASWLDDVAAALLGPAGTYAAAPAHRLSSARQSALMLREGPRLPAVACETGDWSHVDVYLTKTTDYRLLCYGTSRWLPELLDWVRERGSTLVTVGADAAEARVCVRYPHDDVDDVRLLTETLVAEMVAARAWLGQTG